MTLRLNGSTSGYTEIDAPAVAGSNTLVLPGGNGSNGNILGTDGAGNLSWVNGRMVAGTAKAFNWNGLTTNEVIDFENIPSWAKRITVMLDSVSTNGTSLFLLQLGDSGGIETTSYSSSAFGGVNGNVVGGTASTAGFVLSSAGLATYSMCGHAIITNLQSNTWVSSGTLGATSANAGWSHGGTKTLSGTLDRIRITTVLAGASNQFDAGTINILYEG